MIVRASVSEGAVEGGRLSARDVAALTFDAVRAGRFYVITHPNLMPSIQLRLDDIAQLRSQLETVGASGLGERLAALDARVEQATRRKDELGLRASALSLLDEVLVD